MLRLLFFTPFLCLFYTCGNEHSSGNQHSMHESFVSFPDSKQTDPSWSVKNEVVFHLTAEPDNLHPANGNTSSRHFIFSLTQKYLLAIDYEKLQLRPDLVKAMPELAEDQLTYRFSLRPGIRWDNGKPLTSEDVIFTLKANKCPLTDNNPIRSELGNIDDIIPDPHDLLQFSIRLKKPSVQGVLGLIYMAVMQRTFHDPQNILSSFSIKDFESDDLIENAPAALKKWAEEFNNPRYGFEIPYLNGLGAYRVQSWDQGQQLVLERKKHHWTSEQDDDDFPLQKPYEEALPEKIIFRISMDRNAVMLNFKSQLFDGGNNLSYRTLSELLKDSLFVKNYHSAGTDVFGYSYLAFNIKADGIRHPKLFTDRNVRRALALLTPVDRMVDVLAPGEKMTHMSGPVFPSGDEFNDTLQPLTFDLKKARYLLAEAGWKDSDGDNILDKIIEGTKTPFRFQLTYINTPVWKDVALVLAETYKAAGIQVDLKPTEINLVFQKAREHDFDMLAAGFQQDFSRLDFAPGWHTASWQNGSNYSGFGNAETDALIDSSNTTSDLKKRIYYSKKLQEIIYHEQPMIFLNQGKRYIIIHKRFGNGEVFKEFPHVRINRWKLLKNNS